MCNFDLDVLDPITSNSGYLVITINTEGYKVGSIRDDWLRTSDF